MAGGAGMIDRPGAVAVEAIAADDVDQGVAAHYGDPLREQRLLATAAGVVDRGNRGVLAVPGEDRLTWLHSISTQHLSALPPMTGTELLVLSPHGHVEHHAVTRQLRKRRGGAAEADVQELDEGVLLDRRELHQRASPIAPCTAAMMSSGRTGLLRKAAAPAAETRSREVV